MADLDCTSRQGLGRVGMIVVDMRCSGSFADRIADPDIVGIAVEIADTGPGLVDIAGIAGSDDLMVDHSMILDQVDRLDDSHSYPVHPRARVLFHAPYPDSVGFLEIRLARLLLYSVPNHF